MNWLRVIMLCLLVPTSALVGGRKASSMSHAGQPPRMLTSDPAPGTLDLGEIAFIDDGCAFAHRSFLAADALDRLAKDPRAAGLTRVRAIWEQDGDPVTGAYRPG